MLPAVNVIYLRIDHKLIPIVYHKHTQKKTNSVHEGSGKISKLKKQFTVREIVTKVVLHCTCVGFHRN
jgi:hypothetical protein